MIHPFMHDHHHHGRPFLRPLGRLANITVNNNIFVGSGYNVGHTHGTFLGGFGCGLGQGIGQFLMGGLNMFGGWLGGGMNMFGMGGFPMGGYSGLGMGFPMMNMFGMGGVNPSYTPSTSSSCNCGCNGTSNSSSSTSNSSKSSKSSSSKDCEDKDEPVIKDFNTRLENIKSQPNRDEAKKLYDEVLEKINSPVDDAHKNTNIITYKLIKTTLDNLAHDNSWGDLSIDAHETDVTPKNTELNAVNPGNDSEGSTPNVTDEQKKKVNESISALNSQSVTEQDIAAAEKLLETLPQDSDERKNLVKAINDAKAKLDEKAEDANSTKNKCRVTENKTTVTTSKEYTVKAGDAWYNIADAFYPELVTKLGNKYKAGIALRDSLGMKNTKLLAGFTLNLPAEIEGCKRQDKDTEDNDVVPVTVNSAALNPPGSTVKGVAPTEDHAGAVTTETIPTYTATDTEDSAKTANGNTRQGAIEELGRENGVTYEEEQQ